jgi:hypothetical protein
VKTKTVAFALAIIGAALGCAHAFGPAVPLASPKVDAGTLNLADAGTITNLPAQSTTFEPSFYQRGPDGALHPIVQPKPIITTLPDGGTVYFYAAPAPDGGVQVSGCAIEFQEWDRSSSICCRVVQCDVNNGECRFTKCAIQKGQ